MSQELKLNSCDLHYRDICFSLFVGETKETGSRDEPSLPEPSEIQPASRWAAQIKPRGPAPMSDQ